ncbi:MAG: hypothetical protein AB7K68_09780 [Bacteriovoracia bacterium]
MSRFRIGKIFLLIGSSFALVAGITVQAAETLDCDLQRLAGESLKISSPISDRQALVQDAKNALQVRVDASLAPSSFIFVAQDDAKQQRISFTGAPTSLSWDGAKMLLSSGTEFSCRTKSTESAKALPVVKKNPAPYLVCLLDEATFEEGKITKTERLLETVSSSFTFRRPLKISAENEKVAFTLSAYEFDPIDGLDLKIMDKANGETARFIGPPRSLTTSIMFGFTQGDREKGDAKFLRLGCVYTADPKLFLEKTK